MISGERLRTVCIASALAALALGLRVYGLRWGLPEGFEEATPLREAWEMWGWGLKRGVDLNPHFFKYPSLVIYLQFASQGLLYLGLSLSGAISSAIDFHLLYVLDKTPFFVLGRALNVILGTATVVTVYLFGRRLWGAAAGIPAALFLATSSLHVSRSQMIEVDVALTFFVITALWLLWEAIESGSARRYAYAGTAMGLAMSAKYTGALIGVAVLVAYFIGTRNRVSRRGSGASWPVAIALLTAVATFILTSPFVLLDYNAFWTHFSAEREHMLLGHFGGGETPAWLYYARTLLSDRLGPPLALLALLGFAVYALRRRETGALLIAAFLVPYLLGISTWQMRAERYLLPALPLLFLFAGAALALTMRIGRLSRRGPTAKALVVGGLTVLAALPMLRSLPDYMRELGPDSRTVAARWIRENVPPGSMIVTEEYGPSLMGPAEYMDLDPAVRGQLRPGVDCGRYAVQTIPMFQVVPERASGYYDLSLYADADYVITTSSVRSRYMRQPARFHMQAAFYDSLEAEYHKVEEIAAAGRDGPAITIYESPRGGLPFARRDSVSGVKRVALKRDSRAFEADFYSKFGFNYEFFSFYEKALGCYIAGLTYPQSSVALMKSLVLSATRCMMRLGRYKDVLTLMDRAIASAPTERSREEFRRIRENVLARLPALSRGSQ